MDNLVEVKDLSNQIEHIEEAPIYAGPYSRVYQHLLPNLTIDPSRRSPSKSFSLLGARSASYINQLENITGEDGMGDAEPSEYLAILRANILIDESGVPKICDFGLVRLFLEAGQTGFTTTSEHTGTMRYLSPELVAGNPVSTASDIYALGCIGLEFIFSLAPYRNRVKCPPVLILLDISNGVPPVERPLDLDDTMEGVWSTLELCLRRDLTQRPPISNVLSLMTPWSLARWNKSNLYIELHSNRQEDSFQNSTSLSKVEESQPDLPQKQLSGSPVDNSHSFSLDLAGVFRPGGVRDPVMWIPQTFEESPPAIQEGTSHSSSIAIPNASQDSQQQLEEENGENKAGVDRNEEKNVDLELMAMSSGSGSVGTSASLLAKSLQMFSERPPSTGVDFFRDHSNRPRSAIVGQHVMLSQSLQDEGVQFDGTRRPSPPSIHQQFQAEREQQELQDQQMLQSLMQLHQLLPQQQQQQQHEQQQQQLYAARLHAPSSAVKEQWQGGMRSALPTGFPRRVRKTSFDHTVGRDGEGAGNGPRDLGRHQVDGRPVPPPASKLEMRRASIQLEESLRNGSQEQSMIGASADLQGNAEPHSPFVTHGFSLPNADRLFLNNDLSASMPFGRLGIPGIDFPYGHPLARSATATGPVDFPRAREDGRAGGEIADNFDADPYDFADDVDPTIQIASAAAAAAIHESIERFADAAAGGALLPSSFDDGFDATGMGMHKPKPIDLTKPARLRSGNLLATNLASTSSDSDGSRVPRGSRLSRLVANLASTSSDSGGSGARRGSRLSRLAANLAPRSSDRDGYGTRRFRKLGNSVANLARTSSHGDGSPFPIVEPLNLQHAQKKAEMDAPMKTRTSPLLLEPVDRSFAFLSETIWWRIWEEAVKHNNHPAHP
ncbi:hypothetical protein FRC17_010593 [Serendipita sp. 399]|nr:hypothetical protein FRC17_010593 [Serendipita sp. 399]